VKEKEEIDLADDILVESMFCDELVKILFVT